MKLSHETAKKLKDAGFPQKTMFFWSKTKVVLGSETEWELQIATEGTYRGFSGLRGPTEIDDSNDLAVAAPTLEELIDACGDKFEHLRRVYSFWEVRGTGKTNWIEFQAPTSKEAVAALYLALKADSLTKEE